MVGAKSWQKGEWGRLLDDDDVEDDAEGVRRGRHVGGDETGEEVALRLKELVRC